MISDLDEWQIREIRSLFRQGLACGFQQRAANS
jgi:hypothetical protein